MQLKQTSRSFLTAQMLMVILCLVGCSGCGPGTKTPSPTKATSKPYTIKGIEYRPQQHFEYDETGIASYYGIPDGFHGKLTATGEVFNTHKLTAAHKTLPLPSMVRVTNLENGRSMILKVNDRGPFIDGRIIDVSQKAAQLLGFYKKGLTKVRVQSLVEESLALQDMPKGHNPITIAEVKPDIIDLGKKPVEKVSIDFAQLPVQQLLSGSGVTQVAETDIPLPQRRPGWKALKELLNTKDTNTSTSYSASQVFQSGIFLQAGTFSKYKNAERLSEKLKQYPSTPPVRLNTVSVNDSPMFTVRLGPFDSTEDAEALMNLMAEKGHHDAQIIYE